jgi:nitronate monooxygenase
MVPQVVDAVAIPVIAAGGIMDGRGLAAALALGAQAVQMGTVFLTCDEAGASSAYRLQVMRAHEDETALTRAFSGRAARGIVNRVMREVAQEAILPFPLQNALTRPLRTEAARQGRPEFLSLWAGQGLRMTRTGTAANLVAQIAAEAEAVLARLS